MSVLRNADGNGNEKQTAYKRVHTLITHLYAVLVSIHRGTIILHQMNCKVSIDTLQFFFS